MAERQTDSFYLINFIQSTPSPRNSTHSYLTQSNSTQSYLNQSSSTHSCLTQCYSTHSYLIQSFLSNPIQFNPFNPIQLYPTHCYSVQNKPTVPTHSNCNSILSNTIYNIPRSNSSKSSSINRNTV